MTTGWIEESERANGFDVKSKDFRRVDAGMKEARLKSAFQRGHKVRSKVRHLTGEEEEREEEEEEEGEEDEQEEDEEDEEEKEKEEEEEEEV